MQGRSHAPVCWDSGRRESAGVHLLGSPHFEVPFTVGAQLEARASHPELADRIATRARQRGDRAFRAFTRDDFDALRGDSGASERAWLPDR